MSIIIHTPYSRTTIRWASGTSTETFIYPSDGSFAERRFLFRISSATVETEKSTFTFFEGITRHLIILKGALELIHEGRYSKHLQHSSLILTSASSTSPVEVLWQTIAGLPSQAI